MDNEKAIEIVKGMISKLQLSLLPEDQQYTGDNTTEIYDRIEALEEVLKELEKQ